MIISIKKGGMFEWISNVGNCKCYMMKMGELKREYGDVE